MESSTQLSGCVRFPLELCRDWDLNLSTEKQYNGCITNYANSYMWKGREKSTTKGRKLYIPQKCLLLLQKQKKAEISWHLLEILVHASNSYGKIAMLFWKGLTGSLRPVSFLSNITIKQKATEHLLHAMTYNISPTNMTVGVGYQNLEDNSHKKRAIATT